MRVMRREFNQIAHAQAKLCGFVYNGTMFNTRINNPNLKTFGDVIVHALFVPKELPKVYQAKALPVDRPLQGIYFIKSTFSNGYFMLSRGKKIILCFLLPVAK